MHASYGAVYELVVSCHFQRRNANMYLALLEVGLLVQAPVTAAEKVASMIIIIIIIMHAV